MNEDFEKWAKSTYGDNVIDNTPRYQSLPYLTDLKMAYKAGAAAMKERCAEVSENMIFVVEIHELMEMTKIDMSDKACREVAVAIRRME